MRAYFAILVGAVVLSGCGRDSASLDTGKNLIMHRTLAGVAEADGWYTARSTDGGFTVRVPAKFNDFAIDLGAATSGKLGHAVGGSALPGKNRFTAARLPAVKPVVDPDKDFAEGLEQLELAGKLLSKQRHDLLGYPAMDVHIGDNRSEAYSRKLILKDGSLLLTVEQQRDGQMSPADVQKFFDSLTIETPDIYGN